MPFKAASRFNRVRFQLSVFVEACISCTDCEGLLSAHQFVDRISYLFFGPTQRPIIEGAAGACIGVHWNKGSRHTRVTFSAALLRLVLDYSFLSQL